jgi:hypothetical protein
MRIQEANPMARSFFGNLPKLVGRDFGQVTRELWPISEANELLVRLRHIVATGKMSLTSDSFDLNLGPEANVRYRGSIHRIAGSDGLPGAVC